MNTPVGPLIDWHTLGQVLYISVTTGIGIVVLFSLGVYSLSVYRRDGSTMARRGLSATVMGVVALTLCATVVWGIVVIITK
jgi:hypothetical protein